MRGVLPLYPSVREPCLRLFTAQVDGVTIPSKALPVAQDRNSQLKKDGPKFTHSPYSGILEIEKAINKAGAKLIFLPPYSPDFSPIENVWSKVKGILRSQGAIAYKALEEAIASAFKQIDEPDLWKL